MITVWFPLVAMVSETILAKPMVDYVPSINKFGRLVGQFTSKERNWFGEAQKLT